MKATKNQKDVIKKIRATIKFWDLCADIDAQDHFDEIESDVCNLLDEGLITTEESKRLVGALTTIYGIVKKRK